MTNREIMEYDVVVVGAPTTTTSYSIISLFVIYLPWILFEKIILVLVIFTIYFILCI